MEKFVKLIYDDKSFEFPLVKGSQNEKAIDIKNLRKETGLITLDPGYKNSGSCKSEITFLDGEKGVLKYRGYSIEDLAKKSSFLEVSYLLIFGNLPTKDQLKKFKTDIDNESIIDEDLKVILKSFPKSSHPMGILASLTSALTAFNPTALNIKSEDEMYKAIVMIMAKFPILCAWTQRKVKGLPLNYSDISVSYIENISKMFFKKPNQEYTNNKIINSAIDKLLILHADHEQNCSTSTVRIVGSSYAGLSLIHI